MREQSAESNDDYPAGRVPGTPSGQKGILLYHRREAKSPSLAKGWTRSGRGSGKYVPAGQWTPTWYHPRNLPIPWDPGVGMTILFMPWPVGGG